jgi:small subunit ribosomal protein S20
MCIPWHSVQAILAAQALSKAESPAEAVAPLEKLVGEAYKEIDTAVSKGIFHKNTAARKKARVAAYKRKALIAAGLYTPAK